MNRRERRAQWLAHHRQASGSISGSADAGFPTQHTHSAIGSPSVELHVEELILHGFRQGDRFQIGEAMQGELARQIAAQGLPSVMSHGGEIDRLDAGRFTMLPGAGANVVGVQVAQTVFGGPTR